MTITNKTNNQHSTAVMSGILSIVAAGISLLWVFGFFIVEYIRYFAGDLSSPPGSIYFTAFGGLRLIALIASALAITGGIYSVKRKNQWIAMIGVAASIFCFPVSILGIVATIMLVISISRKEFKTVGNSVLDNITPLDIAKERYAKGEITKDEFEEIKRNLE